MGQRKPDMPLPKLELKARGLAGRASPPARMQGTAALGQKGQRESALGHKWRHELVKKANFWDRDMQEQPGKMGLSHQDLVDRSPHWPGPERSWRCASSEGATGRGQMSPKTYPSPTSRAGR